MGLFKKSRAEKRKEFIDALIEGLDDADPVRRLLTLERAARLRRPPTEALAALLGALDDNSVYVRQLAAFVLGRIQDPSTVPILIEALHEHDEMLSAAAQSALEKIATPEALRALRELQTSLWDEHGEHEGDQAPEIESDS